MKSAVLSTILAFSALALAQVSQLPTCAQSCLGSNLQIPGCSSLAVDCICKNKDYLSNLSCCIRGTCSETDVQNTINFAVQICKTANINLDTNIGTNCPSSTATGGNSTARATSMMAGNATGATATARPTSNPAAMAKGVPTGGAGALVGAAGVVLALL